MQQQKPNIATIVGYAFLIFCLWQGVQVLMAGLPKQTAQAGSIGSGVSETRSQVKEIKQSNFKN